MNALLNVFDIIYGFRSHLKSSKTACNSRIEKKYFCC
jgi:hypothetical protein